MNLIQYRNTRIKGVAAAVPSHRERNRDLPWLDAPALAQLEHITGITSRPIAPKEYSLANVLRPPAEQLLDALGVASKEIDALVVVTQTPDQRVPGPASALAATLGLRTDCLTLDIHQGCAGYVMGLITLSGLLAGSAGMKKGLLLVGDLLSHTIAPDDHSLRPLFADAGSATVIEVDSSAPPMSSLMGSFGAEAQTIHQNYQGHLSMNGHAVFTFGLTEVAAGIQQLLAQSNTQPAALDALVMHQANKLLLESIRKKTGFTEQQTLLSLGQYGNTSSASIPVTLCTHWGDTQPTSKRVVLAGFGAGMSAAHALVTLQDTIFLPVIQC